ncbi:MAG: outer membrane beta-barrel protein [Bacteroidales bacterium]|nr:outer membrane beta-barrel protein [Bacteroidales bacterium]
MKIKISLLKILLLIFMAGLASQKSISQELHFGLFAEPLISWFSSDTDASMSDGARPGMAFGITIDRYFARNYAFTGGISMINASGRLRHAEDMPIWLKYSQVDLAAGDKITYKIRYLAFPVGLKMKTNWISYTVFSADMGLSPKIIIGGKGSIPSQDIEKESITQELKLFALGFFFTINAEYPLGGRTAVTAGLGYENIFTDVTKDHDVQPDDKITQHLIRIRLGMNF